MLSLSLRPRTGMIRLLCLAYLLTVASAAAAASFIKRYPSSFDETIFRFNRSRIQQWQHKCRRRRLRRSRRQMVSAATLQGQTSGTRFFWGKPSLQSLSKRFWDASVPEFNSENAGDFTNPLVSVISTVSFVDSNDPEKVAAATQDAVVASSPAGTNKENAQSWWPSVPFLGFSGSALPPSFSCRPLVEGCNLLFRHMSSAIMSRRVLCYRLRVGEGMECYQRVRDFALNWEFDGGDKGIQSVPSAPQRMTSAPQYGSWRSMHPLEGTTLSADRTEVRGRRMVSWTKVGPLFVVSPIAVIYQCINQRGTGRDGASTLFTSCAYATQRGHWLSGEERVTVALRSTEDPLHPSPAVEVEVMSISGAAPTLMGRLAWPFVARMQDKFFVQQLRALQHAANGQPLQ